MQLFGVPLPVFGEKLCFKYFLEIYHFLRPFKIHRPKAIIEVLETRYKLLFYTSARVLLRSG